MNLLELQNEAIKLNDLISDNLYKQRAIHTNNFLALHGLKFGDTVEFMDGNKKVIGVFSSIEYVGAEVNYAFVKIINSDGKVGKRETRIWSWGLKTLKVIESK